MPGVVEINQQVPLGQAIAELLVFIGASDAAEWENAGIFICRCVNYRTLFFFGLRIKYSKPFMAIWSLCW